MKKIIMTLAIVLGMAAASQAQETAIGITAGFGHSWLSDHSGRTLFKPAWNVGGTFIYSTATHWGFGFDVKYSREGSRIRYNTPFLGDHVETAHIDYIRVPIRATYFFNELDANTRLKVSLAPTFGFLAGSRYIIRDNDGREVSNNSFNDSVNSFDFGLAVGAGCNFRISDRAWFTTELTYFNALTNAAKDGGETMNRNVALNVGVIYGIGK